MVLDKKTNVYLNIYFCRISPCKARNNAFLWQQVFGSVLEKKNNDSVNRSWYTIPRIGTIA